jgi:hypothetical protein
MFFRRFSRMTSYEYPSVIFNARSSRRYSTKCEMNKKAMMPNKPTVE